MSGPAFSNVASRSPAEIAAYLRGQLADYPGSGPESIFGFSPSVILETMDTVVLDRVQRQHGDAALARVYRVIAEAIVDTLIEQYSGQPVLLILDAGHGGIPFDPGAEETEWRHNRAVAAQVEALAAAQPAESLIVRRIWNDQIPDRFNLADNAEILQVSRILIRQARASMLAHEAAAWNAAHPDRVVAVHQISIHFNAGSNGALVLHQGETLPPKFAARSVAYSKQYLARVLPALNATGLLPTPLRLWGITGLHDDVMMYRPTYLTDDDVRGITLRYGALQGRGFLPRYIDRVLRLAPT